jgi:hypothetical protein
MGWAAQGEAHSVRKEYFNPTVDGGSPGPRKMRGFPYPYRKSKGTAELPVVDLPGAGHLSFSVPNTGARQLPTLRVPPQHPAHTQDDRVPIPVQ